VVKVKADAGQVTPQDLNLSQADLSQARERARSAEGAHKEAVRSLEVLLGRYPSAELEVAEEYVPVPPPIPAGIPAQVLERRPDMIAAESQVRLAFQNVEAAKLARLPQIGLTGSAGFASGDATNLIGDNSFFSAGANFLAPVFDAGQLEQEVVIQTANQEQALANYGQAALNAFKEVESGLNNERLLTERETLLADALKQNEEALRVARVRYDAGAIEVLEVLQLQARTNLSKSALIDMKNRRLAERIDLHLALGGSFDTAPGASAPARPATRPATAPAGSGG
jgi:outer membrane protein TolC